MTSFMPTWLRRSFYAAIIISLLLHAVGALLVLYLRIPMPVTPADTAIEVFDVRDKQLADQMVAGNRQVPKKSQHIGIEDNAVTAETVARPRPPSPRRPASPPPESAQPRALKSPSGPRNLFSVAPSVFALRQPTERETLEDNDSTSSKRRSLPRTAVSSAMNVESEAYLQEDFYPDYSYGAHTYVNVLRHPDIDYFVRLKRAFRQTWNPIPAVQYSMGERQSSIAVVVAVSVDPQGNLAELFVLRGSGSGIYDDEALRTVRASAPFSSPPPKLLKENLLRMSWTFIVYL